MSFQLEKRTYDWRDLFRIPFSCEPICAAGLVGQKLLTAVVNVLWVLVEASFIDAVLACAVGKATLRDALPMLAAMLLIIFWKRMGWNLGRLPSEKLRVSMECQIAAEIAKKRARLKYSLIEDAKTWELCRRVSLEMRWKLTNIMTQVCDFLLPLVRTFGVLLIIFAQSPMLGIGMLFVMAPLVFVSIKSGRQTYDAFKKAAENERRANYLQDVMTSRDTADERALYAYTDYVNDQWRAQRGIYQKSMFRAGAAEEMRQAASGLFTNLISTVIVVAFAFELYRGRLGIGIFIALSKAIYDIIDLMYYNLGNSIAKMTRTLSFFKDLSEFASLPEAEGAEELPAEKRQDFESLEFRDVSFCYPGSSQYILKHMNMSLRAGYHYAFVGENGAGKTTITKLVTGLYDEYEGSILLNGKELREYKPAELKAMYSNVYQDFARYQDTAQNNIELGDIRAMGSEKAKRRMEEYVKELGIDKELSALPKGLSTHLGKLEDESVDLSGGQWQRVALARSLMNPATLQILDEPTAALDPVSESKLYEELGRISSGRTTIFISHRLGSTKLADHIFVLKDGGVLEEGTHGELMGKKGLYAQMYDSQKSWYTEEEVIC